MLIIIILIIINNAPSVYIYGIYTKQYNRND